MELSYMTHNLKHTVLIQAVHTNPTSPVPGGEEVVVLVQKLKGGGLGLVLVLNFTSCGSGGTVTSFEIYLGLYLHKMFHKSTCTLKYQVLTHMTAHKGIHTYTYTYMMYTHAVF